MPAVDHLYNPFRDAKRAQQEAARLQASSPYRSSSFSFQIQPTSSANNNNNNHEFAAPTSLTTSTTFPQNPWDPDFDPFRVVTPDNTPKHHTTSSSGSKKHASFSPAAATTIPRATVPPPALAPRLVVKLSIHEEVTSRLKMALDDFDLTSEISVDGTVYAQVHCTDARKNAPFAIIPPRLLGGGNTSFFVRPNEEYATTRTVINNNTRSNVPILVTIPKQEIVAVPIAYYSLHQELKFMPVLLERKITRNGARIRIAVQIRSRLDNDGDMEDMTILVAVPERVNGDTITISRGSGVWDGLKRTIKWKLPALYKGDSALVVAEADLWNTPGPNEDETFFPILFRCSSVSDPITPLQWKLAQVSGSPAHISVSSIQHTFRLLHRLP